MLLKDISDHTLEVVVIPGLPDRILVRQSGSSFLNLSIESFVGMMVDMFQQER